MLARMGIEPENRIALVLLDTVDFPVLFWGAIRAGIVPVLVNTRLTVDQYRYLFEDSRAKAVFVSTALLLIIQEAGRTCQILRQSSSLAEARHRCHAWTLCGRLRTKARRRPEPVRMKSLTGFIRLARPECRKA
jgi:acyl-coenzyme A synthetase/AMP-(fatty) acid ligase